KQRGAHAPRSPRVQPPRSGQGGAVAGYGFRGRRVLGVLVLALLLGGAGLAWTERATLLAWYCVRGLAHADAGERDRWVARVAGRELGAALLARPQRAECLGPAREAVRAALGGESPANRLRAVQLALQPGMDLLEDVVALLGDPEPEVRRAAMLTVGPADH